LGPSTFRLAVFTPVNQNFRFAMDRINNGVVGQSYIGNVDTLAGKGRVRYRTRPGSLLVDGIPKQAADVSGLEAIGLTLAEDGTILGKPLMSGQVTFECEAVDSIQRLAYGIDTTQTAEPARTNTAQTFQRMSFGIETGDVTTSDFTSTVCKITGSTGKLSGDS